MKREAEHSNAGAAIAGKARRSPNLRTLPPDQHRFELASDWELRQGVPKTRAECCSGPRPCPYVSCRYHLWLQEAESRPGRRHAKGGAPTSAIRPSTMASCALDVADTGEQLTFGELGVLFGISDEAVRKVFEKAQQKLEDLGYKFEDLFAPERAA